MERERLHDAGRFGQREHPRPRREVPQLDGAIARARREPAIVRAERHRVDRLRVLAEHVRRPARLDIPHAHGAVVAAGRDARAAPVEDDLIHVVAMPLQRMRQLAGLRVPDQHFAGRAGNAAGAGDPLAVAAVGDAAHQIDRAAQRRATCDAAARPLLARGASGGRRSACRWRRASRGALRDSRAPPARSRRDGYASALTDGRSATSGAIDGIFAVSRSSGDSVESFAPASIHAANTAISSGRSVLFGGIFGSI